MLLRPSPCPTTVVDDVAMAVVDDVVHHCHGDGAPALAKVPFLAHDARLYDICFSLARPRGGDGDGARLASASIRGRVAARGRRPHPLLATTFSAGRRVPPAGKVVVCAARWAGCRPGRPAPAAGAVAVGRLAGDTQAGAVVDGGQAAAS